MSSNLTASARNPTTRRRHGSPAAAFFLMVHLQGLQLNHVFVYGTLKEGFPNHAVNSGRRVPGTYRTQQAYPLYVVKLPNEDRAPWLMNSPGEGFQVFGEVFEVDTPTLQAMDALEELGQPSGYVRVEIELEAVSTPHSSSPTHSAYAYLKQTQQMADCVAVEGPYSEYTQELAAGYWLAAA